MPEQDLPEQPSPGLPRALAALLTLVFGVVLIRTAWLSDDAAISLRTVLNLTHGFGLTYNIIERVQTFTHPLWLGLLTAVYMVTGQIYVTVFALSIGLSLFAFWSAVRAARSVTQAAFVALALVCSNAFVDFSTAGLENPLACVLLLWLVREFVREHASPRQWLIRLWLAGACLYLTRPDAVLFALPFIAVACWRVRNVRDIAVSFVAGTLPASAWTLFALIYYGFPFPNTAYAKLAMGIASADVWTQGALYLVDSVDRDPVTLTVIALAAILGARQRSAVSRASTAGMLLYLLYVISIGGDFMSGRFVAVPLFMAVLIVGRAAMASRAVWVPASAVLALTAATASHVPLWSDSRFGDAGPKPSGVVNERAVYFRDKSLVLAKRGTFKNPRWPKARRNPGRMQVLETCGLMGTAGIEYGPYAYLLDVCGLADPLMARLPALFNPEWRTGHYRRMIPTGYRESVEGPENLLQDPALHEYYEHLRVITRSASLFSAERLRTIVAMNTHAYDHLINRTFYRYGGSVVTAADVAQLRPDETAWDTPGNHVITTPLAILCPVRPGQRYLDVTLDSDDHYVLTFLNGPAMLGTVELGPIPEHRRHPGLTHYTVDIPPGPSADGFDAVVIAGTGGDSHYALGHLLLEGASATDGELYRRVAQRDGLVRR